MVEEPISRSIDGKGRLNDRSRQSVDHCWLNAKMKEERLTLVNEDLGLAALALHALNIACKANHTIQGLGNGETASRTSDTIGLKTVSILSQSTLPLIGMLVTSLGWSIEYHTHSDMRLCAHGERAMSQRTQQVGRGDSREQRQ